ncbi:MAG: phosphotransferase [Actinobacteria bacterium]|jgi:hypothetical protein|nr:phosphotransferase [Actinomycetota bacterium]
MMGIADVAVRVRERFVVVDMGVRRRQIGAVGMAVFNLLVDGDRWTLIDWSTAVLADPHYDLAFTDLMLRNPPLGGSPLLRRGSERESPGGSWTVTSCAPGNPSMPNVSPGANRCTQPALSSKSPAGAPPEPRMRTGATRG